MEKDLFLPIKEYFERYGYACDGEVNDIDLYMEKGNESVAVELKQTLDFKAVKQAALRQKITNIVFIGIFKPSNLGTRAFQENIYLLKRLGIGLIVVSKRTNSVEIVSEPIESELSSFKRRNKEKRTVLSEEFQRRKCKNNVGGVRGTKLITSYREDALLTLDALLECGGEATIKEVKAITGIDKTRNILYDNHYGWFSRLGNGRYAITSNGLEAIEEFEDVMRLLKKAENENENK